MSFLSNSVRRFSADGRTSCSTAIRPVQAVSRRIASSSALPISFCFSAARPAFPAVEKLIRLICPPAYRERKSPCEVDMIAPVCTGPSPDQIGSLNLTRTNIFGVSIILRPTCSELLATPFGVLWALEQQLVWLLQGREPFFGFAPLANFSSLSA